MTRGLLRLGVVSFAHNHVDAYSESITSFADARLVAGWDADRARGTRQCAKYGLACEADLDVLLGRDHIDAVFVTGPTSEHAARTRTVPRALVDYFHGRAGLPATAKDGEVCIEMILAAYQAAHDGDA